MQRSTATQVALPERALPVLAEKLADETKEATMRKGVGFIPCELTKKSEIVL